MKKVSESIPYHLSRRTLSPSPSPSLSNTHTDSITLLYLSLYFSPLSVAHSLLLSLNISLPLLSISVPLSRNPPSHYHSLLFCSLHVPFPSPSPSTSHTLCLNPCWHTVPAAMPCSHSVRAVPHIPSILWETLPDPLLLSTSGQSHHSNRMVLHEVCVGTK